MIKVNIYKSENFIKKFEVKDHARYDDYGYDIVCAAVSILTFNTIDTFTDLLNLKDKIKFSLDKKNTNIKFEILSDLSENEKRDSQLILKKYELGIKSLVNEYGDFVQLNYMEV